MRGASVRTATGSVYRMVEDGETRWWLNADNVANPTSRRLDPQVWWRIQQPDPWPPELGSPVMLLAPLEFDRRNPERLPGGGKITSPVRLLQHFGLGGRLQRFNSGRVPPSSLPFGRQEIHQQFVETRCELPRVGAVDGMIALEPIGGVSDSAAAIRELRRGLLEHIMGATPRRTRSFAGG